MRRANSSVGVGVGLFFAIGGAVMYGIGSGAGIVDIVGIEAVAGPASGVFKLIGVIWGAVGVLNLLLFAWIGLRAGASVGIEVPASDATAFKAAGLTDFRFGMAEELGKLAELAERGLLSPAEWVQAKEMYLGKPLERRDADGRLLEQLHDLFRDGGLSESEFNAKKWEILARS